MYHCQNTCGSTGIFGDNANNVNEKLYSHADAKARRRFPFVFHTVFALKYGKVKGCVRLGLVLLAKGLYVHIVYYMMAYAVNKWVRWNFF